MSVLHDGVEQLQKNLMTAQWNCFHWEQRCRRAEARISLTAEEKGVVESLLDGKVDDGVRTAAIALLERAP